MKLSETLQLIKAGFTAKEIREMAQESHEPESTVEAAQNTASTIQTEETETVAASADTIRINLEGGIVENSVETVEKPVDYKALYEKAQADLKAAQRANVNADVGNITKRDLYEDVRNIFRK